MPEALRAAAPAKINLVLEVLGRRSDGYHELSSVMQKVALADTVTLSWEGEPGVTVSGPAAADTPVSRDNLAWRAAAALAGIAGITGPMPQIALEKRIPAASGLGGGASDAATTLRLLAERWGSDDDALVLQAANAVGSDEAFFLGGATAIVTGRGDIVSPVPTLPVHGVVLFLPHKSLPAKTASLFAALSATPFDDGRETARLLSLRPLQCTVADTFNAFERVAFDLFPGLRELRQDVIDAIGEPVRLSGAGPALFWIGPLGEQSRIARLAAEIDGIDVVPTVTLP